MSWRLWPGLLVGGWALLVPYCPAQEPISAPPKELPPTSKQPSESPRLPSTTPTTAPTPTPLVVEPGPACGEPCPAPCPTTVEKHVSGREIYLREVQSATTMPKLTIRTEDVCRKTNIVPQLNWSEQRFTRTEYVMKPREETRDVVCTQMEKGTEVDRNGCAHTVYKAVPVVRQVKITVYDAVPVQKDYLLRTPYLKQVPEEVIVRKLAVDATLEPAIKKKLEAVQAPWAATLVVPAPLPCPAPPACLPK
jgi:hypothetical protein